MQTKMPREWYTVNLNADSWHGFIRRDDLITRSDRKVGGLDHHHYEKHYSKCCLYCWSWSNSLSLWHFIWWHHFAHTRIEKYHWQVWCLVDNRCSVPITFLRLGHPISSTSFCSHSSLFFRESLPLSQILHEDLTLALLLFYTPSIPYPLLYWALNSFYPALLLLFCSVYHLLSYYITISCFCLLSMSPPLDCKLLEQKSLYVLFTEIFQALKIVSDIEKVLHKY